MKAWRSIAPAIGVYILLLALSCKEKPVAPPVVIEKLPLEGAVYVVTDGTGDGSKENPIGSIQAAIELAQDSSHSGVVLVGSGKYTESISINGNIRILGSRNRSENWNEGNDSTIVQGLASTTAKVNQAITLQDADSACVLTALHFVSADGIVPSQSSHAGVFVNCINVELNRCSFISGRGSNGLDGTPGDSGLPGQPGKDPWYPPPRAGQFPIPGGEGGKGGIGEEMWQCGSAGQQGSRGFCINGDSVGGVGGLPEQNGGMGQTGSNGVSGKGGAGNAFVSMVDGEYVVCGYSGAVGDSGTAGCGGGGGGGGRSECVYFNPQVWNGAVGGAGGAGGGPGSGGRGGSFGGSSISILAVNSTISALACTFRSGFGGSGGSGGEGGDGGAGGKGGNGDYFPVHAGNGGSGGSGGKGGAGGGGAGGNSVAVYLKSSKHTTDAACVLVSSSGGLGGGPGGAYGATGFSAKLKIIL